MTEEQKREIEAIVGCPDAEQSMRRIDAFLATAGRTDDERKEFMAEAVKVSIEKGNIELLKRIVGRDDLPVDYYTKDSEDLNLAQLLACIGDVEITKSLVEAGIAEKKFLELAKQGLSGIALAINYKNLNIMRRLLNSGMRVHRIGGEMQSELLFAITTLKESPDLLKQTLELLLQNDKGVYSPQDLERAYALAESQGVVADGVLDILTQEHAKRARVKLQTEPGSRTEFREPRPGFVEVIFVHNLMEYKETFKQKAREVLHEEMEREEQIIQASDNEVALGFLTFKLEHFEDKQTVENMRKRFHMDSGSPILQTLFTANKRPVILAHSRGTVGSILTQASVGQGFSHPGLSTISEEEAAQFTGDSYADTLLLKLLEAGKPYTIIVAQGGGDFMARVSCHEVTHSQCDIHASRLKPIVERLTNITQARIQEEMKKPLTASQTRAMRKISEILEGVKGYPDHKKQFEYMPRMMEVVAYAEQHPEHKALIYRVCEPIIDFTHEEMPQLFRYSGERPLRGDVIFDRSVSGAERELLKEVDAVCRGGPVTPLDYHFLRTRMRLHILSMYPEGARQTVDRYLNSTQDLRELYNFCYYTHKCRGQLHDTEPLPELERQYIQIKTELRNDTIRMARMKRLGGHDEEIARMAPGCKARKDRLANLEKRIHTLVQREMFGKKIRHMMEMRTRVEPDYQVQPTQPRVANRGFGLD